MEKRKNHTFRAKGMTYMAFCKQCCEIDGGSQHLLLEPLPCRRCEGPRIEFLTFEELRQLHAEASLDDFLKLRERLRGFEIGGKPWLAAPRKQNLPRVANKTGERLCRPAESNNGYALDVYSACRFGTNPRKSVDWSWEELEKS